MKIIILVACQTPLKCIGNSGPDCTIILGYSTDLWGIQIKVTSIADVYRTVLGNGDIIDNVAFQTIIDVGNRAILDHVTRVFQEVIVEQGVCVRH